MVKSSKAELMGTKRIYQGYGLFTLCYALTRIFFLGSDYEMAISCEFFTCEPTILHNIYVVAAYTVTTASLVFIFFSIEKYILNRRRVFMVVALISLVVDLGALILTIFNISAVEAKSVAQYVLYVTGPILAIALVSLYLIIIKSSTGDIRKKAILTFLGILLIVAGLFLDMDLLSTMALLEAERLWLAPFLFITGALIFIFSQK
ncbi:MAG: hypothetical protein ACTSUE_12325 [Promethearchaeota archaeon]